MHSNGLDQIRRSLQQEIDALSKSLGGLDSRLDKQKFFEYNNTAFMIPKKFEYSPVRRDEVSIFSWLSFYLERNILDHFTALVTTDNFLMILVWIFGSKTNVGWARNEKTEVKGSHC